MVFTIYYFMITNYLFFPESSGLKPALSVTYTEPAQSVKTLSPASSGLKYCVGVIHESPLL